MLALILSSVIISYDESEKPHYPAREAIPTPEMIAARANAETGGEAELSILGNVLGTRECVLETLPAFQSQGLDQINAYFHLAVKWNLLFLMN